MDLLSCAESVGYLFHIQLYLGEVYIFQYCYIRSYINNNNNILRQLLFLTRRHCALLIYATLIRTSLRIVNCLYIGQC